MWLQQQQQQGWTPPLGSQRTCLGRRTPLSLRFLTATHLGKLLSTQNNQCWEIVTPRLNNMSACRACVYLEPGVLILQCLCATHSYCHAVSTPVTVSVHDGCRAFSLPQDEDRSLSDPSFCRTSLLPCRGFVISIPQWLVRYPQVIILSC